MINIRLFITSFLLLSSSSLLLADEGTLSDGTLRQTLNPDAKWIWDPHLGGFYACTEKGIILSNGLNTTGIHEVRFDIVYLITKNVKSVENKTDIPIAVIGNGEKVIYYSKGEKFGRKLKTTLFIPLQYQQTKFGIKHENTSYCTVLWSLKITYKYCKNATFDSLVKFPRTNAPDRITNSLKVVGTCNNGNNRAVAYCKRNGEWWYNETLPCKCKTDQVPTQRGCFDLSRVIQNVDALRMSNTQVWLSWTPSYVEIPYKVKCFRCHGNTCQLACSSFQEKLSYNSRDQINGNIISGLETKERYMFSVIPDLSAFNMSKSEAKWSQNVFVNVLPGKVRNITITHNTTGNIMLSWQPPKNHQHLNISYNVLCDVSCLNDNCSNTCSDLHFTPSSNNLIQPYITIKGLRSDGAQYHFRVYTVDNNHLNQSAHVQWNYETIMFYDSFQIEKLRGDKNVNVIDVVIGVSALVVVVVIAVTLTIWYNKRRASKHLVHSDIENHEFTYSCETPLTSGSSHYVDPADYETMNTLLQKFNKKLNDKHLKTNEVIGEGEFGVVCRGYLSLPSQPQTVVAVKCLRAGLSAKIRRDFLAEASVMGQFNDPNIVSLHGVVVKRTIVKIVMEYMSNGSLDTYLVKNNARLTTLQLLGMARGIASGMKYLSGRNFIHRDLAARNILVDQNLCCKVSDFGLTRELCTTSNYETTGGKIPIRWTAPEVIKCKTAFFASDVWSFGVVLWEIMAFGQRPYWDWDNFQVMQEIESGYRLPAPPKCPKSVHGLMLDCWERERTDRPQFSCIVDRLDEWIRSPETIDKSPTLSRNRSSTVEDKKCPIQRWLSSIKMARYRTNFTEAGYRELHQVSTLTEDDLLTMGIKLVGHRHKIYQSIAQISNFNNDVGSSVSSDVSADVNSDVSGDVNNSSEGRSL